MTKKGKTGPQEFPMSAEALADARSVFERVLLSDHGVQLTFNTHKARHNFRSRLYMARKRDREATRKLYPPDSQMYGKSSYDCLSVYYDDDNSREGHYIMLVFRQKEPFGCVDIKDIDVPFEEE